MAVRGTTPELFTQFEPVVSDEDVTHAADEARIVVSFRAKPINDPPDTKVGFLALKVVFPTGKTETILLDQFCGRMLHTYLESLNKINWDGASLVPKGSTH